MRNEVRSTLRLGILLLFAGFSTGQDCGPGVAGPSLHAATVDMDQYVAGELGSTVFTGGAGPTAWLSGCSVFRFEQRVDGQWQDRGQPFECVWEGFALPVAAGEDVTSPFSAPANSGLWRLHYPVGEGCDATLPQSACDDVFPILTNVFTVEREPCPPATFECQFAPAAPNYLCPDGVNIGGPSDECTRDPSTGVCGYEFRVCP